MAIKNIFVPIVVCYLYCINAHLNAMRHDIISPLSSISTQMPQYYYFSWIYLFLILYIANTASYVYQFAQLNAQRKRL